MVWCFVRSLLQLTCGSFCLLVLSSASKMQLNRVEIRRLTRPLKNIPLFYLQKLLGCFTSSSICAMKRLPISFAAFDRIWAESISLYTSEFIRLLLSSVMSSINTSNPEPLEAIIPGDSPKMLNVFGSWAVPSLLHTVFFPSFWCSLILIPAVHRMLFQKCSGTLDVFWPCLWWSLCICSGEVFYWL